MISIIPCAIAVFKGQAGRLSIIDGLIFLHPMWACIALVYNNGLGDTWQGAGMYFIETVGPYALARCYILSRRDFINMVSLSSFSVLLLLPLAAIEAETGRYLKTYLFDTFATHMSEDQMRLGMHRAFTTFDHPILFGVFCASIFGLVVYCKPRRQFFLWSAAKIGAIGGGTFFSLSSGPMLAFIAQGLLLLWEQFTRTLPLRFAILGAIFVIAYVAIDMLSNRAPFVVMASYLSLDAGTATGRADIWHWGMVNVAKHPVFGLGLNDWERGEQFATASMDAFWLFLAVFYGLPGALLMIGAVIVLAVRLGRAELDAEISKCRMGWMISVVGLAIAGIGVHYWGQIYCWFMFLLGSSAWMLEQSPDRAVAAESKGNGGAVLSQGEPEGRGAQPISGQTHTAASRDANAPARFCRPEDTRWLKSDD